MKQIGSKLQRLRENAKLTQIQIADFLEVDTEVVIKIENNDCLISSSTLDKLSALFFCPVSVLLSDVDLENLSAYNLLINAKSITAEDLLALSAVHKIALNQFEMDKIARV